MRRTYNFQPLAILFADPKQYRFAHISPRMTRFLAYRANSCRSSGNTIARRCTHRRQYAGTFAAPWAG
jgi:hypothetical protein